jgi:putative copper export protein/mono/diheme cytochrome c family protein
MVVETFHVLAMDGMPALVTLLRIAHVAAMVSALGTAAFIVWLRPAAVDGTLRRWGRVSGLVAVVAGLGWLLLEAGVIAGADDVGELVNAIPVVVTATRFGQVVSIRLLLLLLGSVVIGDARKCGQRRTWTAFGLFAAASVLQGLLGHAGAAEGLARPMLVLSEALHLLAAGVWLGGLVPLWLVVRRAPADEAAAICERFSPIGLGCVFLLAGTGVVQGVALIGDLPALLGTRYGHIALVKIVLFVAALALAALNRLWLTDRLTAQPGRPMPTTGSAKPMLTTGSAKLLMTGSARGMLMTSILLETAIGLAVVAAAAFLASSVPGVHESPVWPLPWRFTLATVQEDADFRQEVIVSAGLICGSFLLIWIACLARRFRLLAIGVFAVMVFWRSSSMALLTAEAYPTSFQGSPNGFAAASIVRGGDVFRQQCAGCHGAGGTGDGPRAAGLRIRPDDLTQPHIWEHADGDIYWWISHGIEDPEGGMAMPGFAGVIAPEDRWALIDYVHALATGAEDHQKAIYEVPVPAPSMGVSCPGLAASSMADLAGRFLLVVTRPEDAIDAASHHEAPAPLLLSADGETDAVRGGCVAQDQAAWGAYATLAGVAPDRLAGAMFLVDRRGWLRAVRLAGDAAWRSPDGLQAAIAAIERLKIDESNGGSHEHHH